MFAETTGVCRISGRETDKLEGRVPVKGMRGALPGSLSVGVVDANSDGF